MRISMPRNCQELHDVIQLNLWQLDQKWISDFIVTLRSRPHSFTTCALSRFFLTIADDEIVESLFVDARIRKALKDVSIGAWGQLRSMTLLDLLQIPRFGYRSLALILSDLIIRETVGPSPAIAVGRDSIPIGDSDKQNVSYALVSPRDQEMLRLRLEGETFEEIGCKFGVTRERVRQVMNKLGAPNSSQLREKKQARQEALESAVVSEFHAALKELVGRRGPQTVQEVSEELNLENSFVASNWPVDLKRYRVKLAYGPGASWNEESVLKALRDASVFEFPLSAKVYSELVRVGEVAGPSVARIEQLFRNWHSACEAAGIESPSLPQRDYQSRWTDQELLEHARSYFLSADYSGAIGKYDEWRRAHEPEGPSAQTLRNRLGSWGTIRRLALSVGDVND